MSKEKIIVAMSGGVDSSVAAYLAICAGAEVIGVHLKMEPDSISDPELQHCCEDLNIRLIEHECSKEFYEKVLLTSAQEYVAGRTPNPCCQCNRELKFAELFRVADQLGIRKVFTGHYVRLNENNGVYSLKRGVDPGKDQSYFLYRLTQNELSRCGFPLGELTKADVRRIASDAGLACAVRKDSQDACFQIPGECCGETLRRRCQLPVKRGNFIYQGKKVGYHDGIHRYTIGQRQGLNVALGVPAYVKCISADTGNIELVTDQKELLSEKFLISNVSWQSGFVPSVKDLTVKVRYRSPGIACRIEDAGNGRWIVYPAESLRAVTTGQAAVFYNGEFVAGGGVIENV